MRLCAKVKVVSKRKGYEGTPLRWAAAAVRADKPGAPDLVKLLRSAGATLAKFEKVEFQSFIDGGMGKRKNMRAAFIGCPGSTTRTSLRGSSIAARSNIHLREVFTDMSKLSNYWAMEAQYEMSSKTYIAGEPERATVLKLLEGHFNTDAEAHSETDTLLLYYSGHGHNGTGNWG